MPRAKLQLRSAPPKPVQELQSANSKPERLDRNGTRMIGGHFPVSTWEELRLLSVRERRTSQELLAEALEDLFAKYPNR